MRKVEVVVPVEADKSERTITVNCTLTELTKTNALRLSQNGKVVAIFAPGKWNYLTTVES